MGSMCQNEWCELRESNAHYESKKAGNNHNLQFQLHSKDMISKSKWNENKADQSSNRMHKISTQIKGIV